MMRALCMVLLLWCATASSAEAYAKMGRAPFNVMVLADELELSILDQHLPLSWDAQSWMGGNYHRLWVETEGDVQTRSKASEGEASLFYGYLFAPFWEVRVGVRGQMLREDGTLGRGFLAIGLEGLAPYLFEVEPDLYVSQHGDVSARLKLSYGLRITQRLVFQPSSEINLAVQSVPRFHTGSGVTDLKIGARLRYELMRELAPYVGFEWQRKFGETADFVTRAGGQKQEVKALVGIRLWI